MKPKVLISSPSLYAKDNVSGISSLVADIINSNKTRFIHLKLGSKDNEKKNIKWFFKLLYSYAKAFTYPFFKRFQIVHLNIGLERKSILRDFLIHLILKKVFRKKVVFHVHGGYFLMNESKDKLVRYCLAYLFNNSDKIIVLSEFEKQELTRRYGNLDFQVLPNAININPGLELKDVRREGILKLIFLGRINTSKGIFVISDAFKYLQKYFDQFQFDIYGTGPDLDKLLNDLSGYQGLNFAYHGVISGLEKWEALYNSDVFLLPSVHSEGMPISILEAMASVNTVIVTDDASIISVVKNNQNGIVIKKNDPEELASKIEDIILRKIDTEIIAQNAFNYINANVSINKYTSDLNEIYERLVTK
ncbi:glycosyltransferase family 4 protein [Mucilaginibacter sp.]|uniref:glycosyltransferase family 4 protein n=1 Tax=Mucilaginibacter sp. TaxID=1882438 RepID=UPI00261BEFC9|nr:glycosyltransferase family 4 protein [Mucilaginibacter sp.]MDB4919108.1 glycosyltransferase family 1 protein [Mucilaginibacter sp.]